MRNDMLRAKKQQPDKKPELTLDEALTRYWDEHGQHLHAAMEIHREGRVLLIGLGADTLLPEITNARVASFVARRRTGQITLPPPDQKPTTIERYKAREGVALANATVNKALIVLRAVLTRADLTWEVAVPRILWKKHFLTPVEQQRILSPDEEGRLFLALADGLKTLVDFALASGLRLKNVINLKWSQVNWIDERLAFRTKSKKPGGEFHYLPITARIEAILKGEVGRDSEYVFTYACRKTVKVGGMWRYKGERYHFSEGGWRKDWYKALKAAGLWYGKGHPDNFRFHDLRHTAGTRTYQENDDLYLVQKFLGHSEITTTERYAKMVDRKLRAGMEKTDRRSQIRSHEREKGQNPDENRRV
jgi:integrase